MIKKLFKNPIIWIIITLVVLIIAFIIVIIPNLNKAKCPKGEKIYDYCGDKTCRPICEVGSYNCKTGCSGCPGPDDIKCGDNNCCNPANCKTGANGKKFCCSASQFCPTDDDPSKCCGTNEICDKTKKTCVEKCGTDSSGKPVTCDNGNTCIHVKNMNQAAMQQFLTAFKGHNPRVDSSGNGFVCAEAKCKTEPFQFPDGIDGFNPCSQIINKSDGKDFGYCTSNSNNQNEAYSCWENNAGPTKTCKEENCTYKSIFDDSTMSSIQDDQNMIFRASSDITQKNLGNWCGNNNQQILQFKKSEKSGYDCTIADCWDSIKDFENVKFVNFDGKNICTAIRDCDKGIPVDFVEKGTGNCPAIPPGDNRACKDKSIICNLDGSITDVSTEPCSNNNRCDKAITAGLGWCLTSGMCQQTSTGCDAVDDIYLQSNSTQPHDNNLIAQCGCDVGPSPTVLGLVEDDPSGKLTCTTPEIKYDNSITASCSGSNDIVAYTENRSKYDIIWKVTRTGTGDDVLCEYSVDDTITVKPFSNTISLRKEADKNPAGWYIESDPTFTSSAYSESDTYGTLHLSCPQVDADENAYFVVDFPGPYTTNGTPLAKITQPPQDSPLSDFSLIALQADWVGDKSDPVINILFVFYPTKLSPPTDTKY